MGANVVAKAWVQIIPEMSGSQEKIAKGLVPGAKGAGERAGKEAGGGFSSAFKGAMGALTGIIAAVGFGQLVSEAAAATDATQKFKSTLDFAGLGTPEIEALSKSTRKYADETVYALSDIQNITAQLAANSVPNYDKLAEAAGNLNAVAGGNAETFKSVGMVLTQTAGAGKLTTENWNQLADAIPGASGKLQEAMFKNGAYTGNFREAMEKGQISADEFNQAIMDLGFEDAAVKAAKSTSTFEGAFGNMQAAVVGGLSDILTRLQPAITGAMNAVTPVIEGALSAIAGFVGGAIDALGSVASQLAPVFAPVVTMFRTQLLPALQPVGAALQNLASAVLPALQAAIGAVAPALASLIGHFVQVATTIATVAAPAVNGIAQMIQAVLPVAQAAFEVFGNAVKGVIDAVFPFIQALITDVMNAVNAVISTVLAAINGDWAGVWNGIKALAQAVWDGIKSIVTAGINAAKGVISSVLNAIKGIWDGAWSSLKSFMSDIWEGIKSGVRSGIDGVMGFIGGLPGKITGLFADAGTWLVNSGKAMLDGLADGIRRGIDGAVNAVKGGLSKIRSFFPFSPAKEGPFSGRGWVLYSGISIAEALGEGFELGVPSAVGSFDGGMGAIASAASVDNGGFARSVAPSHGGGDIYNLYLDGRALHVDDRVADAMERFVDVVVAHCG